MKQELSEEQLIELAKKAKRVEVQPEGVGKRLKPKVDISSVISFIQGAGIAKGRNEVKGSLLYDAYRSYTDYPVGDKFFFKEMNKILKRSDNLNYKVNMKIITIIEKLKELKNEQTEKNEVSRAEQKS